MESKTGQVCLDNECSNLLQIHVTFNPDGKYAVEGLKPDTLYRFSLAARSEMGLGVYTQPIEARTAQSSKSLSRFPPLQLTGQLVCFGGP